MLLEIGNAVRDHSSYEQLTLPASSFAHLLPARHGVLKAVAHGQGLLVVVSREHLTRTGTKDYLLRLRKSPKLVDTGFHIYRKFALERPNLATGPCGFYSGTHEVRLPPYPRGVGTLPDHVLFRYLSTL